MKTIRELNLLAGQEAKITISEFRKNPGDVFTQVELGLTVTITRNGKPIALIQRVPEPPASEPT